LVGLCEKKRWHDVFICNYYFVWVCTDKALKGVVDMHLLQLLIPLPLGNLGQLVKGGGHVHFVEILSVGLDYLRNEATLRSDSTRRILSAENMMNFMQSESKVMVKSLRITVRPVAGGRSSFWGARLLLVATFDFETRDHESASRAWPGDISENLGSCGGSKRPGEQCAAVISVDMQCPRSNSRI
jgi:hypothetical protein